MNAVDPVCGMTVDTATAQWKSAHKGHTYYFCAPGCKASFDRDPEKFLQGSQHSHTDDSEHRHDPSEHPRH